MYFSPRVSNCVIEACICRKNNYIQLEWCLLGSMKESSDMLPSFCRRRSGLGCQKLVKFSVLIQIDGGSCPKFIIIT